MKLKFSVLLSFFIGCATAVVAQDAPNKFAQIDNLLPTPNVYRAGSGAPGHKYWQQSADYKMNIILDDTLQRIYGEETITYYNNSPDQLKYLWLQLDQNARAKDSDSYKIRTSSMRDFMRFGDLDYWQPDFDGGFDTAIVPKPQCVESKPVRIVFQGRPDKDVEQSPEIVHLPITGGSFPCLKDEGLGTNCYTMWNRF